MVENTNRRGLIFKKIKINKITLSSRYSASSFFSSVSSAEAATTASACARYAAASNSAPYGGGVHASASAAALTTSSGIRAERTRPAWGVMCVCAKNDPLPFVSKSGCHAVLLVSA